MKSLRFFFFAFGYVSFLFFFNSTIPPYPEKINLIKTPNGTLYYHTNNIYTFIN